MVASSNPATPTIFRAIHAGMKFSPGQEVVCVDDRPFRGRVFRIRHGALLRGATHTVRDYVPQADWIAPMLADEPCLRVNEIERKSDGMGFRESRFRAVDPKRPAVAAKRGVKESV
jgi:hypothetical protein